MNIAETVKLAEVELAKHDALTGWTVAINKRKASCGLCNYRKKRIELSAYFIERNSWEEIMDTILHEIAHALTPGDKHGPRWRAMAAKIGARPERTAPAGVEVAPYKYGIFCTGCEAVIAKRHKRSMNLKRRKHSRCTGELKWIMLAS